MVLISIKEKPKIASGWSVAQTLTVIDSGVGERLADAVQQLASQERLHDNGHAPLPRRHGFITQLYALDQIAGLSGQA